jgi:hypothetical protein
MFPQLAIIAQSVIVEIQQQRQQKALPPLSPRPFRSRASFIAAGGREPS